MKNPMETMEETNLAKTLVPGGGGAAPEGRNPVKTLATGSGSAASDDINPAKPLQGDESQGDGSGGAASDDINPMETTEGEEASSSLMLLKPQSVGETTPSRHATGRKRRLVEIFSVLCLEEEEALGTNQILEENLVLLSRTSHKTPPSYVLCNISPNKPLEVNPEGCVVLTGPDCGIEVEKYFSLGPFYDVISGITSSKIVWDTIRDNPFENFMCNWLELRNGFMVVKFAVYRDGLEARLELTITDLEINLMPGLKVPLMVYGTVVTSNSAVPHSQAKSYLFDHIKRDDCVVLTATSFRQAEVPLPLSRRVTVIPRESTLIVDVSLFVRYPSGDIPIANESVSFHAGTRSNSNLEEHIINGHYAKVKVKVNWIEAFEYDKDEGEEKEGLIEDGEAVDEEFDSEDDEEAGSEEAASDDDSSFRSLKLRRFSISQDVSTRIESPQRSKEHYLEVFSVKLLGIENLSVDEIYGLIMIYAGVRTNLLFRRVHGYPCRINSEGFAILEGPRRCGWNVCDHVSIIPFLFKYQELDFTDDKLCYDLWRNPYYDKSLYDNLLCKIFKTDICSIEVNFAVYEDGVEVHLSVMLTDCCFSWARVHGTITASNSMLRNTVASTVVLEKNKIEADCITVGAGKEISLPLSRPIIALPIDSSLTLNFHLLSDDGLIIHKESEFSVQFGTDVVRTLPGNGCQVEVKMRFFCYQDCPNFPKMEDECSFF